MADVQTDNGYTRLANETVEALARVNLTAYQQRVLWAIWRKTYGWQKKADSISRSQFKEMTGIYDRHIVRSIKELEAMNMITVERSSTRTAVYSFQKNHEAWLVPYQVQVTRKQLVPNEGGACALSGTKTCTSTGTHKRKKETYKRNIAKKLSDKGSLSLFLIKKNPSINALIPEFVNKVRMANKYQDITSTRAAKIADALGAIAEKYSAEHMAAGIQSVLRKAKREGFNFTGNDPAAYVRTVAKSEHSKTMQQQAEAAHRAERDALRAAPAGGLFTEIEQTINQ